MQSYAISFYVYSKLKVEGYVTAQHKPVLKSPQSWHLNKGELRPTGSLSDIVIALAYVNPGSEAVSVIAVKTLFCILTSFSAGYNKHTLFRHFVIVMYCKYT